MSTPECNILICGSQRFTERSFVFKVLTTFYQLIPHIDNIILSKTSGACEFAQDWVDTINNLNDGGHQIGVRYFDYDPTLENNNCSLYEGNIPDFVMQDDKFFKDGVEQILKNNIQAILAIPNPEGQLGVSTKNIKRFCSMAGKSNVFFDCSELHTLLNEYHNAAGTSKEALENINLTPQPEPVEETSSAFGNLKKISPR